MLPRLKVRHVNVVLIAVFVALCLACGGDPEDPPPGSIWERLCGKWVSDPVPLVDGNRVDGSTKIEIEMSYWTSGLRATYPDELALRSRESVVANKTHYSAYNFTVNGTTATSDPSESGDGSTWSFRVDPDNPDVMYATWILKNGSKRLEEVRFTKEKQ